MTGRKLSTKGPILIASGLALALFLALAANNVSSVAVQVSSEATITVVFTPDGMGFEATSSKDLSNVIVEYCDLQNHKHEFTSGQGLIFNHTDTQVILGVWVKSGDNGVPGGLPAGAGERFTNVGADCFVVTTTAASPPVTTDATVPTSSATTTGNTVSTSSGTPSVPTNGVSPTTPSPTNTTQIPVFPSAAALALACVGSLAGAFMLLRRRN